MKQKYIFNAHAFYHPPTYFFVKQQRTIEHKARGRHMQWVPPRLRQARHPPTVRGLLKE